MGDSLLIAIAVGLVVWILMRRLAYSRARQKLGWQQPQRKKKSILGPIIGAERSPAPAEAGPAGEATDGGEEVPDDGRHMPRMGVPGTLTRVQIEALRQNNFEPNRMWSKEEAQLILDSVLYFQTVIFNETGDDDPPLEVQNRLLAFILTDETLREGILDWARNRARGDDRSGRPELPRDTLYENVAAKVAEEWESEPDGS